MKDIKVTQLAPGHWAGHMRIYHRMCKKLVQEGYSVELVGHPLDGENLESGIELRSLGKFSPSLKWQLLKRLQRCKVTYNWAINSKAALFQYSSPEFIWWAAKLRRETKRPVVFDCMEDFEGYALQRRGIPNIFRKTLARIVRSQLIFAARHCDAIITADQGTANFFLPYAKHVVVIHNFPELSIFPDPEEITHEKPFDIIYHGSIPRYHLETCFKIDEALTERGYQLQWRFFGNCNEMDWLEKELSQRQIGKRFFISQQIPHTQVAQEVAKGKVGIIPLNDLPKFQNNIPQKLFEFMALRIPVVMSDLPPSRPFVGDGKCAFMVPPRDYAAYADAIIHLLTDPALCHRMGAEGRRRVEQEYNWEKESGKLIHLYKELLGS